MELPQTPRTGRLRRNVCALLVFGALLLGGAFASSSAAWAATPTQTSAQLAAPASVKNATTPLAAPDGPSGPSTANGPQGPTINIDGTAKPSVSISILLLITILSVAPSVLLMMTSFTKIFVVLSLTRNAMGMNQVPPNQVIAGLSLFLSLFIMGPVLSKVNNLGVQPYLNGSKTQQQALHDGMEPLRTFMLKQTRPDEIALMLRAAHRPNPAKLSDVDLTTLIPAFVLSELRAAMIIGFVVFVPFLIIDLVVASSLMSMGMMMLPPVTVSMPFKLLLFVMVDGWGLIISSLVSSYNTS